MVGGVRFGIADIYVGQGKMLKLKKNDFKSKPNRQVIEAIERLGLSVSDAGKKSEWINRRGTFLKAIGGRSWVKYSLDIEKNLQTKLFLACCGNDQVEQMIDGFKFELQKELKCY